jgi:hypothetical protein
MRLAYFLVVAFLASLLVGCGEAASGPSLAQRPAARFAGGAAGGTLADGFRACGATQTPPASVLLTSSGEVPPVLNRSAGDIDDSTAGHWAAAFWREQAIESWALASAGQDGLLRGPCLSAARVRLAALPGATPAGQSSPCGGERCLALRLTVAVTSLPMVQALVLRHGGNPSRYVVEETVLAAGRVDTLVVGGVYQDGPIGPIWFVEASGLDCLDPAAARLGLECGSGVTVPEGTALKQ